jgi:peroxiredoxin
MFLNTRKVAITVLVLAVLSLTQVSFAQKPAAGPADFSLRSINGQTVTAQSLRGKVAVLAFGASWLPLSRTQLQSLKKVAERYGDRGVIVYWISTESENTKAKNFATDEQLRAFGQKYGGDITVLRDPDMAVARRLGAVELPSIVILDKQGNLSGEAIKGLDADGNQMAQLTTQLDKIL